MWNPCKIKKKRALFDVLFTVRLPSKPEESSLVGLIIDLEVQKTLSLPYDIESRGIYYMARQISSQLNYVFEDTKEYSSLKKVYGIWICLNDIPKSMQNTIVWHNLLPSRTYGIENEKAPCKDLMEMVIIRLGNGEEIEPESDILRFLYGIFEYPVHSEYFYEFVSTQEVEQDEDLRKEINEMEGVGLLFYNDMIRRGRKELKEVVKCLNAGVSEKDLIEKGISPETIEEAKELMEILA